MPGTNENNRICHRTRHTSGEGGVFLFLLMDEESVAQTDGEMPASQSWEGCRGLSLDAPATWSGLSVTPLKCFKEIAAARVGPSRARSLPKAFLVISFKPRFPGGDPLPFPHFTNKEIKV